MADLWHYRLNGFEIGPVPASEVRRLLQKGRLALDTPVRPEESTVWATAEKLGITVAAVVHVEPAPPVSEPAALESRPSTDWPVLALERLAPVGVPLGAALVADWGTRPVAGVGWVILASFAGIGLRILATGSRNLGVISRGGST
jgi:hypothetical protein